MPMTQFEIAEAVRSKGEHDTADLIMDTAFYERCKRLSYDQAMTTLNDHEWWAYCYLWRNEVGRFSTLAMAYELMA